MNSVAKDTEARFIEIVSEGEVGLTEAEAEAETAALHHLEDAGCDADDWQLYDAARFSYNRVLVTFHRPAASE